MNLKEFGKTGRKVSEIGMGTFYDPAWIATSFLGWRRGAGEKLDALRSGLDAGITMIDTAEIYGSEPIVAEAIHGRKRDELFLATKVWPLHLRRDSLLRSFEKSRRRLRTDYIDLYQVHMPNRRVPIGETMGAMQELVDQGKLRHVGVSNFNLEQVKEAQVALPKSELVSVQLDYSLVNRSIEEAILPYCQKQNIALMAYYPLGHGKLSNDSRLDDPAKAHGKTRSQVALKWLSGKPCVFPIPRASKASHVTEDAGASGWDLSQDEILTLESRFS